MLLFSIKLLEKKTGENEEGADHLLHAERMAEDQHRAEDGEELSRRCKNRAGQRAEPFDGQKDEVLREKERERGRAARSPE